MAMTRSLLATYVGTVSQTGHTQSVALTSGTGRKIVVHHGMDSSVTVSSITFNGNALTNVAGASITNTSDAFIKAGTYYYDVPDGTGAGNYDVVMTVSSANANQSFAVYQLTGAASGAPEATDEKEWTTTATNNSLALTATAGACITAFAVTGAATSTWTISGGTATEDTESNESAYTSVSASAEAVSAGAKTVTATVSEGGTGNKCLVGCSWAAPAGPTITSQPTAQTARVNGESAATATFSISATASAGSLTYDWELETDVASGTYANLADGSGATWTGQTASSCTATFTAKTITGRRVRCNVTDSNGTVTSDAVVLTVFNGPVTTSSSAITNASGVGTLVYHSDDALTTNGEVLLWTLTAGTQTFYIATRPS